MTQEMNRIRVVHLTTVHSPFDVRIFHKECVTLADAGFDVTLVQRSDKAEIVKGVRIAPLPTYGSRLARMTLGVWRAVRLARRHRPHVVHFHDVELIWGALFLKLSGSKVVYDIHEDVAKDLEDKAYLPRWSLVPIRLAVRASERLALTFFDRMSAATASIAARFPAHRASLIRNTPILGELAPANPRPFSERGATAVYLGGLADLNGPRSMVAALAELPDDLDAKLILGGKFPDPKVEAAVRSHAGWKRVDYRGWVARENIPDIFAQARCGLVLYQPSPNVIDAEPNKFFELLSAGIPLVASNFPLWQQLIQRFDCGLAVDPTDPKEIARAIEFMMRNPDEAEAMGKRGQGAVLSNYNWSVDAERLVALYRDLTKLA